MKRIKLLILMGCLIFISNVKAMNPYWKFIYEYNNADMTASISIWNRVDTIPLYEKNEDTGLYQQTGEYKIVGKTPGDGIGLGTLATAEDWYKAMHLFIPDHVIYNGQNYTVTAIKKGAENLGWSPTRYDAKALPIACDSNFYVYIPKTIQSIEDSVFCGRGSVKAPYSPLISGEFYFYFEGLTGTEIIQKFEYVNYKFKWFIENSYVPYADFGDTRPPISVIPVHFSVV